MRAGERGQRHRLERRAGGRQAGRRGRAAGDAGVDPRRQAVAHLALARAHRDRAVALHQLEARRTLPSAPCCELLDRDVLAHAHELFAAAGPDASGRVAAAAIGRRDGRLVGDQAVCRRRPCGPTGRGAAARPTSAPCSMATSSGQRPSDVARGVEPSGVRSPGTNSPIARPTAAGRRPGRAARSRAPAGRPSPRGRTRCSLRRRVGVRVAQARDARRAASHRGRVAPWRIVDAGRARGRACRPRSGRPARRPSRPRVEECGDLEPGRDEFRGLPPAVVVVRDDDHPLARSATPWRCRSRRIADASMIPGRSLLLNISGRSCGAGRDDDLAGADVDAVSRPGWPRRGGPRRCRPPWRGRGAGCRRLAATSPASRLERPRGPLSPRSRLVAVQPGRLRSAGGRRARAGRR